MDHSPLTDPHHFTDAFAAGLERMLAEGGLGAFILVLANALTEPALQQRLGEALGRRFHQLAEAAVATGQPPAGPADDQQVFAQLLERGLASLQGAERRAAGPFEARFNPLRALRPPRMTATSLASLQAPFDATGFHFNRPFLLPERLWAGQLLGRAADLFYNKFPFVEGHLLLVPEREAGRPQWLMEADHHWLWQLAERLGTQLPGALIAYNSFGAFASVNHLHAHLIRPAQPLPVLGEAWGHWGGPTPYPAPVIRLTDRAAAWAALEALHGRPQPYHLLYLPGQMVLLPRRFQGSYSLPPGGVGTTWYEMAGGVVAFERGHYERLGATDIAAAIAVAAG